MRMMIVTNDKVISLGVFAKDIFAETVLKIDEDKSFYVVQTVEADTVKKAKKLPIDYGITQEIKDGIVLAFEDMDIGAKFLCVDDWTTDFKSVKAKADYYWQIQKDVNGGMEYVAAVNKANETLVTQSKRK